MHAADSDSHPSLDDDDAARQQAIADELGGDVLDHNVLEAEEEQPPQDMWLSPQERQWAQQIKEFVEGDESGDGIEPLTDFEYAEHAIVAEGNLEEAVERIRGLQSFRELYQPQHTAEDGVNRLRELCRQHPRVLFHLEISKDTGTCMCAWNYADFDPSVVTASEEGWKTFILGEYYIGQAMQPTFLSVRQGSFQLVESKDLGWHNFDMNLEQRYNEEILHYEPVKANHIMVYNSGVIMNLVWSLMKPFMREELSNSICLAGVCDPENPEATLMDFYCQPTLQAAEERMLENCREYLTNRFNNYQNFRL